MNRAPLQAMPLQPALELASAAVRTTHELREDCRKLGVEYSISECAEQLADKLQAQRAIVSDALDVQVTRSRCHVQTGRYRQR